MGMAVTKQEAFWEACGFGNTIEVKKLLKEFKEIDVNWKSYTHDSCAIHVASQGKAEIVQLLIDHGCDVNVKDDRGSLPIHHAAMKGHADIIKLLIDNGSEINSQDKNGWTPMINAAYWCHAEAVSTLLEKRGNPHLQNKDKRTALHEACRSQSTNQDELANIVEQFLEVGCDMDSKSSDHGEADFTPLMFCAYHNHPKVAKLLIDHDCHINDVGSNGWTALHWASHKKNIDVAEVLINGGIDVTVKGRRDDTAYERTRDPAMKAVIEERIRQVNPNLLDEIKQKGENAALFEEMELQDKDPERASPERSTDPANSVDVKETSVYQAMQEQMKEAQRQLTRKRSERSMRKLPDRLFKPPEPPAEPAPIPQPENVVSISSLADQIGFADDSDDEAPPNEVAKNNLSPNGNTVQQNADDNCNNTSQNGAIINDKRTDKTDDKSPDKNSEEFLDENEMGAGFSDEDLRV